MGSLSSVCECDKTQKKENIRKIDIKEKGGKESEVKLGQKWMKNRSENCVR